MGNYSWTWGDRYYLKAYCTAAGQNGIAPFSRVRNKVPAWSPVRYTQLFAEVA